MASERLEPRNLILRSLPAGELDRIARWLEPVEVQEVKLVLIEYDRPIEHAWFPENCVLSVLSLMADGTAIETATVGHEGMLGIPLHLGVDRIAAQAFCQVPGRAIRMPAEPFREAAVPGSALNGMLNRYTQALFTQVAQASACNRRHTAAQRCARWLLETHDRVGRDEFPLTQQFLSQMLGVRRATVGEIATTLQAVGVIDYSYGVITVRDRAGLEQASCECYAIVRREYARLLEGREWPSPLEGLRVSEGGISLVRDGLPPHDPDPADAAR